MAAISPTVETAPIIYPESDGKPMGETDTHRQEMMDAIATLLEFYRERQDVYVAGNLLLYYEQGNPAAVVSPDVFVVLGIPKRLRRTYKLWEEQRPPAVVIEVSSRSTRLEDLGNKRALYESLGVREYFLFDPLEEYLHPPLQGFRLANDELRRIAADETGGFVCQTLGLRLETEHNRLRFVDLTKGERLLRPDEVAAAHRVEAEARRVEAEARRVAEERLMTVEAELARLRRELDQLRGAAPADEA